MTARGDRGEHPRLSLPALANAHASKLPPLDYPGHFEVRYVSFNGGIRWKRDWVNASIVCAGEYVGLEKIANGSWNR